MRTLDIPFDFQIDNEKKLLIVTGDWRMLLGFDWSKLSGADVWADVSLKVKNNVSPREYRLSIPYEGELSGDTFLRYLRCQNHMKISQKGEAKELAVSMQGLMDDTFLAGIVANPKGRFPALANAYKDSGVVEKLSADVKEHFFEPKLKGIILTLRNKLKNRIEYYLAELTQRVSDTDDAFAILKLEVTAYLEGFDVTADEKIFTEVGELFIKVVQAIYPNFRRDPPEAQWANVILSVITNQKTYVYEKMSVLEKSADKEFTDPSVIMARRHSSSSVASSSPSSPASRSLWKSAGAGVSFVAGGRNYTEFSPNGSP